jgi:hypothetical protein
MAAPGSLSLCIEPGGGPQRQPGATQIGHRRQVGVGGSGRDAGLAWIPTEGDPANKIANNIAQL